MVDLPALLKLVLGPTPGGKGLSCPVTAAFQKLWMNQEPLIQNLGKGSFLGCTEASSDQFFFSVFQVSQTKSTAEVQVIAVNLEAR
ncbi:hypothetical protein GN956_G13932 [Arapaima gigas]